MFVCTLKANVWGDRSFDYSSNISVTTSGLVLSPHFGEQLEALPPAAVGPRTLGVRFLLLARFGHLVEPLVDQLER